MRVSQSSLIVEEKTVRCPVSRSRVDGRGERHPSLDWHTYRVIYSQGL